VTFLRSDTVPVPTGAAFLAHHFATRPSKGESVALVRVACYLQPVGFGFAAYLAGIFDTACEVCGQRVDATGYTL
jgi:hypothetical protein